jgi:hypothetical protein
MLREKKIFGEIRELFVILTIHFFFFFFNSIKKKTIPIIYLNQTYTY